MTIKGVHFKWWHLAGIFAYYGILGEVMWPLPWWRFLIVILSIAPFMRFCFGIVEYNERLDEEESK